MTASWRDRTTRVTWVALPVVLLGFVVWGTVVLFQQVGGWLNVVVVAPVVLLLGLRVLTWRGRKFRHSLPGLVRTIAILLGAVVFPLYGLVGFASLWTLSGWEQLDPLPSLAVGAAVLGIAAWIYVHPWWVSKTRHWPLLWATTVVVILVVGEIAALEWAHGSGYGYPRTASVVATEPSRLVVFPDGTVIQLVDRLPAVGRRVWATMHHRLSHDAG